MIPGANLTVTWYMVQEAERPMLKKRGSGILLFRFPHARANVTVGDRYRYVSFRNKRLFPDKPTSILVPAKYRNQTG